jgi:CHAT domain-containing protein
VLSGLVLAGANLPVMESKDSLPGDDGILTAEMIVDLPLDGLELAVLSACESGLGEEGGGEGVFGLQRAFHLAGAADVVASLWRVSDEATAALMGLFYYKLWGEGRPPLQALREAQLTLYHHPERIPALAKERGNPFVKVARLPAGPGDGPREERPPAKEPLAKDMTKLWAGFVLSGAGR